MEMDEQEKIIFNGLNLLVEKCHENAEKKSWWNPAPTFAEGLMLIVSELSEALEDFRDGYKPSVHHENDNYKPVGIPSEMADVIIRMCDLCGGFKIPLAEAVIKKMQYNATRTLRHGGKIL